ncbi:hypothetical protein J6590_038880 [Homalodisca vitripennis]|nr:hypothetical protein J6590_038880 [Homalodisca vitripennis]
MMGRIQMAGTGHGPFLSPTWCSQNKRRFRPLNYTLICIPSPIPFCTCVSNQLDHYVHQLCSSFGLSVTI